MPPEVPAQLSCREIRHVFWQVILAVGRSVTTILHWSAWRRWHQAWARYYHNRRRSRRRSCTPAEGDDLSVRAVPVVTTNAGTAIPETIPEEVWQVLEHLLPPANITGRPYAHDRGQVLRGLIHVFQTGCGWRDIPATFPPAKTIYGQFRRWQQSGIWTTMWTVLTEWCASGTLPVVPYSSVPFVQFDKVQDADERANPPLVVPETVWSQMAAVLPTPSDTGRPYAHDRRHVVEAILYKQHTGCGWRRLPTTYPPVKTVYGQFRRWQKSGHWDRIVALLSEVQWVGELQL